MHYSTHAIAPLYKESGSTIESVICVGGGTMSEKLVSNYGNPFPIEDCLLCFENGFKGQVVRGLFECSAPVKESFNIYGSKKTVITEYNPRTVEKIYDESKCDHAGFVEEYLAPKNYYKLLPKEIHWTTVEQKGGGRISSQEYLESAPLSGHGGSHPHLCHEFVSCILENRPSSINEDVAANITAAGICAHISAIKGGEKVLVPKF